MYLRMTKSPFIDSQTAAFTDFRNIYESGNPTALHELLEYCEKKELAPPRWAKEEIQRILKLHFLGKVEVGMGRHAHKPKQYKSWMDEAIRRQAYSAVRKWQRDPRLYEDLPTRVIELWFDKELKHTPNTKEHARFVTC